jgi:hypothetical protein
VTVVIGSRYVTGPAKASLIALAAGIVMGTQSVLLDATVDRFDEGAAEVFTAWQTYLLVAASIGGLLLIQSAFQGAGPLAASMPVIDATKPAVAITVGVGLFHETVRVGLPAVAVTAAGAAFLLAGIVLLDTFPLLNDHVTRPDPRRRAPLPDDGAVGPSAGSG